MKGNRFAIGATLAAAVVLGGAWASGSGAAPHTAKASSKGGIVTYAEQPGASPTYIFPLYSGAYSGDNNITALQPLMWLPLYWFGHSNSSKATINYSLSMANAPVFSNGNKTVTIKLKHYVWSDGTTVTSRDVSFWMHLMLADKNDESSYAPGDWMDHVVSMTAPNATTFVINMNVAYSPTYFLYNDLSVITPIPQHSWDKESATGAIGNYDNTTAGSKAVYKYLNSASMSLSTWDTNPVWQVVDGPFHLKPKTGFQVTGQVIMLPNAKYNGPNKPKISELEELPFTSATAEYDALQSGSVDYGYVPTTDIGNIAALKSNGYAIDPWYEYGMTFAALNYANPKYAPLESQLYIRQAMQTLINQKAYIKSLLLGYGTPTYGPVPIFPASSFLAPAAKKNPYPYSVKAAKKLLTSHGWKIPSSGAATCQKPGAASNECGAGIAAGTKLSIPFEYSTGTSAIDNEAQAMQSAFASAGIALTLKEAPVNTVVTDAFACIGKTKATCSASSTAISLLGSPDFTYIPNYYPDGDILFGCGASVNMGGYCSSTVDAMIKQITTGTTASSKVAMDKYQLYVAKQLPVLWFPNSAYQISAISSKLGGVTAQDSTGHIYPSTWFLKS
ncbi:MAG TPA: ABC transporter substrate-binding protein [Acidimicrobiales bacterium]|nr:ABC transporter substrate-binding protein [Acidimicrobiales bacterium]